MSLIIAKGEQITRSSNNTSTSNQMFSFGKGKRFDFYPKSYSQNVNFYNIPSCFNSIKKNGFSMGKGDRTSFANWNKKENEKKTYYYKENSFLGKPSANFGQPPLAKSSSVIKINTNGNHSKDYSGVDHELYQRMNINIEGMRNKNEFYTSTKFEDTISSSKRTNNTGRSATIKGKLKTFLDVKSNNVPGPGAYSIQNTSSFNPNRKSISGTAYFAKTTSKRFKYSKDSGPGYAYMSEYGNIAKKSEKIANTKKDFSNTFIRSNSSMNISRKASERLNFSKEQDKCKSFSFIYISIHSRSWSWFILWPF